MRCILASAIALALSTGSFAAAAQSAAAQPVSASMDAVTTQLPAMRLSHYTIEVTPHAEAMTFDGKARIDIEVLEATNAVVLQAIDMTFANSIVINAKGKPMLAKVSVDAQAQTATFAFDKPLAPGNYVLSTDYTGKIGTQANGFFALDYPTANGKQRALYTQPEKLRCASLHSVLG